VTVDRSITDPHPCLTRRRHQSVEDSNLGMYFDRLRARHQVRPSRASCRRQANCSKTWLDCLQPRTVLVLRAPWMTSQMNRLPTCRARWRFPSTSDTVEKDLIKLHRISAPGVCSTGQYRPWGTRLRVASHLCR